jgi:undecaprenyl-diphosphatase
MFEIFILSIVQGLTEFLPISSSSHLILMSKFLFKSDSNLMIDISLHVGSLFAIIIFFSKKIVNFFSEKSFLVFIIIASLPTLIIGFILGFTGIIEYLREPIIIGIVTIIFGLLLFISDKNNQSKNLQDCLNLKSALIVGFFQCISLIPGVSRSGITITAARFLGISRKDSLTISFLLSVPILIAVGFFNFFEVIKLNSFEITITNIVGIVLSFIFSYLTIKYFFKFVEKFNFNIFVIYRIILGLVIITLYF